MNRLLKIMYATTAGLEQAAIVWETMKQTEKLALEQQPPAKRIGFATGTKNDSEALTEKIDRRDFFHP